ncbi:outer membrane protein B-like [Anopheles albimanus]|nr:outer membrane protein B-like [Anopheles albimanus]
MQLKKTLLLCALLVAVKAEPQPQTIIGALSTFTQQTLNSLLGAFNTITGGLAAGTTGNLTANGTLTLGASIGSIGIGGTATFNSNLPVLNLLNNVVNSTVTAVNQAASGILSATGSLLNTTAGVVTNALNTLLGVVNPSVANIGTGLSGSPTTTNGNIVINALNTVNTAVNNAITQASQLLGNSTVATALGSLPATLNADLATAIQAIQNATANPGTATTLLGALGPNGISAIGVYLADAANIVYTAANLPLQLYTQAAVNATLNANAAVPYTAAGIAAVNSTINGALTNANNVLNSAVGSFNNLIANVQPATAAALSTATSSINSSLNLLNNVINLFAGTTKQRVTAAVSQALNNITSLVTDVQTSLQLLNNITLNAVVAANVSISGNASAVIQPMVANLASTNATIVACSQAYLPLATRTNVYYTTALGSCVVQATAVADILLANTVAVVNSAVSRLTGTTDSVTACLQLFIPTTTCTRVTVPNAPAYINNVALDVATIKTGEVVDVASTANQVTACTTGTANSAAADFAAIASAYNQCIGA